MIRGHVRAEAEAYLRQFGDRARAHAEDDKSRAIGRSDWAAVMRIAAVVDEIARMRE